MIVSLTGRLLFGVTWSCALSAALISLLAPLLAAVDAREVVRLAAFDVRLAALDVGLAALDVGLAALDVRLAALDVRLAAFEAGLAALDVRLAAPDRGLAALDVRFAALDVRFDALEPARDVRVLPLFAREEPVLPLFALEEPLLREVPELRLREVPELREPVEPEPALLLADEPLLLRRELLPGERLVEPPLAACARVALAPLPFFEVDFALRELVVPPRDVLFDFALVPEPDPLLDDERPRADDDRLADPRCVVAAIFLTLRFVQCALFSGPPYRALTHRYPKRGGRSHPGRMFEPRSTFP